MLKSYFEFKNFLKDLKYRPKLLLHCCCAPCSSHVVLLLCEYFEITILYTNDNIYPKEEFMKRLLEVETFIKKIEKNIKVISIGYNEEDYNSAIQGLENLGERSQRCYVCYKERLEKTALYAKENGFEYFTTSLSISPYKVEEWINEIGYQLEEKYQVKYLYSNFKKEEGYKHSIELSNTYGLYRQDYCGCKYSMKERLERYGITKED